MTTHIPLASELVPLVLSGQKTSTVRIGKREYSVGPASIVSGKIDIPIEITDIRFTKLHSLDDAVARMEGYDSLATLRLALEKFYPGIEGDRDVTVIRFRKL